MIREAQNKVFKRENWKKNKIRGQFDRFIINSRRILKPCGRVGFQFLGECVRHCYRRHIILCFRFILEPQKILSPETQLLVALHEEEIAWFVERCLTCRKVKAKH